MKPKTTKPALPLALRLLQLSFRYLGPIFPQYFGQRAYQIWLTPQHFTPPEIEQQALLAATSSSFLVGDVAIKLYRWGAGPCVLFVHGWSGRGSQAAPFIEQLTDKGFSVLSFDAPAHGDTAGKHTNLFAISEVILALQQNYGDFHAAITHSFGGMVLPYAIKQGLRVGRVANVCPTASLDVILANFQRQLCVPARVVELMRLELYKNFGVDLPEKVSTLNNVSALTIPALIIHDADDEDIPLASGQQVAAAWPNARFMLTHQLGHRRILRNPDVVQAVVDFISSN